MGEYCSMWYTLVFKSIFTNITEGKLNYLLVNFQQETGKKKTSQAHEALRSFVEVCHAGITQLPYDRSIRAMYINEMDMKDQM